MEKERPKLEYTSLKSKSVVDRVQDWIISQIIVGNLRPGDKLPTELELCSSLGAGRNSVREAIKKLEASGVIYIKRAEGTFIAQQYSQKMLDPLLYGLILQNDDWKGFIDLRRAIDIGLLYVVVRQKKSLEDMASLHKALANLEDLTAIPDASAKDVQKADSQFHHCLAEMSHSPQLITLSDYINRITIPSRLETTRFILEREHREQYIRMHQQIVQIVETSDVSQIEEAITNHYTFWIQEKPTNSSTNE